MFTRIKISALVMFLGVLFTYTNSSMSNTMSLTDGHGKGKRTRITSYSENSGRYHGNRREYGRYDYDGDKTGVRGGVWFEDDSHMRYFGDRDDYRYERNDNDRDRYNSGYEHERR